MSRGDNDKEFDFGHSFETACELIYCNNGYNSEYLSLSEFKSNMIDINNNVDKISDKIWRNLNDMKNEIKEDWLKTAQDEAF